MNKLQKDHKKALKRKIKQKKYGSYKTGRAKVQLREQKESRKKTIEQATKKDDVTTSSMAWSPAVPTDYGYESK